MPGASEMPDSREPIPLTAHSIQVKSTEFATICDWPFEDDFVKRLLRDDIPARVLFGNCQIFLYRDPKGQPVGFGTLDLCAYYTVGGVEHPYIPLLAVNPTITSLGYGTSIVRHLVGEAAVLSQLISSCDDTVFLEVYSTSTRAVALYKRELFQPVTDEILDSVENKPYVVMAKRVSTTTPAAQQDPNLHNESR